jgi:hypothetical protein
MELRMIVSDLAQPLEDHEKAYADRTNNLNNLHLLIKRLQKKGSANAEVQTDFVDDPKV